MVVWRNSSIPPLRDVLLASVEMACVGALAASVAALGWAAFEPAVLPVSTVVAAKPPETAGSPGSAMIPPDSAGAAPTAGAAPVSSAAALDAGEMAALIASLGLSDDPFIRGGAAAPAGIVTAAGVQAEGYTLHATRSLPNGEGSAILSAPDAPQSAYAVGDAVGGGARLATVGAGFVELDLSGRRLRLEFPKDGGAPGSASAASSFSPPPASQGPPPGAPQGQAPQGQAPGVAVDRTRLVNAMTLRPVTRGPTSGFEIIPRGDTAILAAAGLQPGDIVTRVNGASLTLEHLSEQTGAILSGAPITIDIERGGRAQTITLQEARR